MNSKGSEIENWNWQAYERKQGNFQSNSEEGEKEKEVELIDFDLVKELGKVEEELKIEKLT